MVRPFNRDFFPQALLTGDGIAVLCFADGQGAGVNPAAARQAVA
jgi:hypothetical protein